MKELYNNPIINIIIMWMQSCGSLLNSYITETADLYLLHGAVFGHCHLCKVQEKWFQLSLLPRSGSEDEEGAQ